MSINQDQPSSASTSKRLRLRNGEISSSAIPIEDQVEVLSNHPFLGPTSFSAVLTENLHVLGTPVTLIANKPKAPSTPSPSESQVSQGVFLIQTCLKYEAVWKAMQARVLLGLYSGVLPESLFLIWVDRVPLVISKSAVPSKPRSLRDLSRTICINTLQPLPSVSQTTSMTEWAHSITEINHLRWELFGLITAMYGFMAHEMSDWESVFTDTSQPFVERSRFTEDMQEATDACHRFCSMLPPNEITIYFLIKSLNMVDVTQGTEAYPLWNRSGEICNAIIAMGLHRQDHATENVPLWLGELRKHLLFSFFGRDKVIAISLGRPVRLAFRFCTTEMPLDLHEDELMADHKRLSELIANPNTRRREERNYWSIGRRLMTSFQLSRCRERTLEIALGHDSSVDVITLASSIRADLQDFTNRMEEALTASRRPQMPAPQTWHDRKIAIGHEVGVFVFLTAGYHCDFLLAKAMVSRSLTKQTELIPCSSKILGLLTRESQKPLFRDLACESSYLLLTYGLSPAAIIAVELLKPDPAVASRSEAIQDLSVFIQLLKNVEPKRGLYHNCHQAQKSLQRILNQVLDPNYIARPASVRMSEQLDMNQMFPLDMLSLPMENDSDFWQWLNDPEWP